jgi:hypothetical protein
MWKRVIPDSDLMELVLSTGRRVQAQGGAIGLTTTGLVVGGYSSVIDQGNINLQGKGNELFNAMTQAERQELARIVIASWQDLLPKHEEIKT